MNEVQSKILDIYKSVLRACNENKIPFFAIGGTCLGAVRHNGFIPWDDDMDIAIPIEYFSHFKDICQTTLYPEYELYDCDTILHYPNIFCKVMNPQTTFIEDNNRKYPDTYKGIFIDIMPLSGVPEKNDERRVFLGKQHFYNIANSIRRFSFCEMPTTKIKILWVIMLPFKLFVPFNFWSKKWIKLLEKYPLSKSSSTGYVWSGRLSKLVFPTYLFSESIEIPFEDTFMKCPIGANEYLSLQFGEYMKMPKESERISGHAGIISADIPFREYVITKSN